MSDSICLDCSQRVKNGTAHDCMKPKDQSAIERFDKTFEMDILTYRNELPPKLCVHVSKIKDFLSKELSLAEQRGRKEAIEEVIENILKRGVGFVTYGELIESIEALKKDKHDK